MPLIDVAYDTVALAGMFLAMYVMQAAEHDRINRIDHPTLCWFRRLAFVAVALALCYSILDRDWQRSLPVVLLVGAGVVNLTINAMAITLRKPPNGRKIRVGIGLVAKRIRHYMPSIMP